MSHFFMYKGEQLYQYIDSIFTKFNDCVVEEEYVILMKKYKIVFFLMKFSTKIEKAFLEELSRKQFLTLFKEEFQNYHHQIKNKQKINNSFYESLMTTLLARGQKELFYPVWDAYLEGKPILTHSFLETSFIEGYSILNNDYDMGNVILQTYLDNNYQKEEFPYYLLLGAAFSISNSQKFIFLLNQWQTLLIKKAHDQENEIQTKIESTELPIYDFELYLGLNFEYYELMYRLISKKRTPFTSNQLSLLGEVASKIDVQLLEKERSYKYQINDILKESSDIYQKNMLSLACTTSDVALVKLVLQYKLASEAQIKDEIKSNKNLHLQSIFDAIKEHHYLEQVQKNSDCDKRAKEEWIKTWGTEKQKEELLTKQVKKDERQVEQKKRKKI